MNDIEILKAQIRQMPLPPAVRDAMAVIRRAGGEAYVVGGAIRDWVWDRDRFQSGDVDWDLAANLPPQDLRNLRRRVHPGERFGTFDFGPRVEVTTMRKEGGYDDARHPGRVEPIAGIKEDLGRRDFTVNAIAVDGERVVAESDLALLDLAARCLRAVGDPTERFREDPLRILRLARFRGRFGAFVEPETAGAARDEVTLTRLVSRERRLAEFYGFLEAPMERWSWWCEAGLAWALEWPLPRTGGSSTLFLRPPRHRAARLLALAYLSYDRIEFLGEWARQWPLQRLERQAIDEVARVSPVPDADRWMDRAADWDERHRWIFAELAEAFGRTPTPLEPLALTAHDLMTRWGLQGPELGAALRHLRALQRMRPDINQQDQLDAAMRAWLQDR